MPRRVRYFLLLVITTSFGYALWFGGAFLLDRDDGNARPRGEIGTLYTECLYDYYDFSKNNHQPPPIDGLDSKDRATLLGCAAKSGNYAFLKLAIGTPTDKIDQAAELDHHWPLESIAAWPDADAAVDGLKLYWSRKFELFPHSSWEQWIRATYAVATVPAAKQLLVLMQNPESDPLKKIEKHRYAEDGLSPGFPMASLAQYHAFKGRLDVAQYFSSAGSEVAQAGVSVRHLLLQMDKSRLLDDKLDKFLVANGVARDELDAKNRTVLRVAVALGNEPLAARLFAQGANPDVADDSGDTPLHEAARHGLTSLVNRLLARANPNVRNNLGRTPLHEAFTASAWDVAGALLSKQAKLDIRDALGRTALFECVSRACPLLDRLAAAGAQFNVTDSSGNSLLHDVGDNTVAQMLIERGAPVDVKNAEGKTALHIAAEKDNPALATLLLSKGATVNGRDHLGNTPLHFAQTNEVISALLNAGANPDLPNKAGVRPVNKEVGRSLMLFHSPAQIYGKKDTLVRYFSAISVANPSGNEKPISSAELVSPTFGYVGNLLREGSDTLGTPEVKFVTRAATLDFRIQYACEVGVLLRDETGALQASQFPIRSEWKDLAPLEGKINSFRVRINPGQCVAPAMTAELVQATLGKNLAEPADKWGPAIKACTQAANEVHATCELLLKPTMRVLVKIGKDWKEAGILRVRSPDEEQG